jgi:hypothetical protein
VQTTNPIGQRRNNLAVLARAIWQNPGISRRELVDRFDIDESSVSRLVGLLLSMGLVEATDAVEGSAVPGPAPGGRRRVPLRICPEFGQVWGLTLWRDRILSTVCDIQGRILATGELHLGPYGGHWGTYLDQALAHANDLAGTVPGNLPLLGIGFGVPGWVDSETSTIVRSDEFGLVDTVCPRQWHPDLPVLWENDANCGAWSGLSHETPGDDVYVLGRFLENGPLGLPSELSVGFGLMVGGQVYRGWRHNAGEFMSALWKPGSHSAYGVTDEIFGRCRSDREAFLATVSDLLSNLRFASRFLDPRSIQLGGDLKHRHDDLVEACRRITWHEGPGLLRPLPQDTDEVSYGAALLVLDELFQRPGATKARTLFGGYGTGTNDPLWRGIPIAAV